MVDPIRACGRRRRLRGVGDLRVDRAFLGDALAPDLLQETVHAFDAARVPRLHGLQRPEEHQVEAQRVGAVALDDFVGIGDVATALGHLFAVLSEDDALMEKFSKIAVKIDGSVSLSERNKAVEAFQGNDKIRLFVGNIKAAGVGLTLTASSNVVFLELPWTPGDLSQAEDRCHRIGQKDSVNIYFLLAPDTIEERLAHILDSKRKVLDAVLDGEITAQESLLTELIKGYIS